MVSCRCTSRITRDFRCCSNWAILRVRMASIIRSRRTGCGPRTRRRGRIDPQMTWNPTFEPGASSAALGVEPEDALIGVVPAVVLLRQHQQGAERKGGEEAANIGPPRHVGAGQRCEQVSCSLQNLEQ